MLHTAGHGSLLFARPVLLCVDNSAKFAKKVRRLEPLLYSTLALLQRRARLIAHDRTTVRSAQNSQARIGFSSVSHCEAVLGNHS